MRIAQAVQTRRYNKAECRETKLETLGKRQLVKSIVMQCSVFSSEKDAGVLTQHPDQQAARRNTKSLRIVISVSQFTGFSQAFFTFKMSYAPMVHFVTVHRTARDCRCQLSQCYVKNSQINCVHSSHHWLLSHSGHENVEKPAQSFMDALKCGMYCMSLNRFSPHS